MSSRGGLFDAEFNSKAIFDPEVNNKGLFDPDFSTTAAAASTGIGWFPRIAEIVRPMTFMLSDISMPTPVTTTDVSWWHQRPPDVVRQAIVSTSVVAAPVTVPVAAGIDWWYPRSSDVVGQPLIVFSTYSSPVTSSGSLAWHHRTQEIIRRPLELGPHIAWPVFVQGGLSWQFRIVDSAQRLSDLRSQSAQPVSVQGGIQWQPNAPRLIGALVSTWSYIAKPPASESQSNLPWLLTGVPSVLPSYPLRPVWALSPTTPVASTVTLPWMTPPYVVTLPVARYENGYAKPVQPLNPDGRSDLPWLLTGTPSVRSNYLIQSFVALLPTTPVAGTITLPWMTVPRIIFSVPRIDSVYALLPQFNVTATQTLTTWTPVVQQVRLIESVHVAPLSRVSLSWFASVPPLVRESRAMFSMNVAPLILPLTHGWRQSPPDVVRTTIANWPSLATPIRPLDPDGRSAMPWLVSGAPRILAEWPTYAVRTWVVPASVFAQPHPHAMLFATTRGETFTATTRTDTFTATSRQETFTATTRTTDTFIATTRTDTFTATS